ncbi:MAG TPA: N-acetyl-alpha-D-glucosaminyl L-malate synthase BshA [Candidatus Limnocylindria bacterium]|nr:N-acetyl-alpha-D-glucosaminyl L-malate synthase BshA [Candidatus Limnocylindria bacterium]
MEKRLKIGIVCYPTVGGSGIVASQLGNELANLGHQVHFISYDPPFRLNLKKRNITFHKVVLNEYSLFKYPDYTLPLSVKMVAVANKYNLDIMHVHYAVPHATAALLAKDISNKEGIKFPHVITTLHGTDITLLGRDKNLMPVIKYAIEYSCGVTAVSNSLKKDTLKVLKTKKDIQVIHNFYTPLPISKSRTSIRKGLKIKDNDFLAIHLSNLRPVKRIPDLLKIMAKSKSHKHIKLLILAGGDFKPYQKLVKQLGIGNKIIVKENVLDIENYINAADVGLYTSGEESFGMGVLEAMAYQKPVLATNAGGIPEFMQNGKTGYLFNVGAVNDFAKKLIELSLDPKKTAQLGQNAKHRASTGFCSQVIVKQYEDYYRKIMRECKGTGYNQIPHR